MQLGVLFLATVVGLAAGRLRRGADWPPAYARDDSAKLTATAVRLPDGTVVPLVAGRWHEPGAVAAETHPHDDSVTVVVPGRVWHVRADGSWTAVNLTAVPVERQRRLDTALADEWSCALAAEIGAELTTMLGVGLARDAVATLVRQARAVLTMHGAVGMHLPADSWLVDSALGVGLASPDATLAALRDGGEASGTVCARYLFAQRSWPGDSTLGIAYVGGGCSETSRYGCVFDTLDPLVALLTTVHELGHTEAASHDTSDPSNVMYPTLGGSTELEFTAASLAQMQAWAAAATCLVAAPPADPTDSDGADDTAAIIGGSVGGGVLVIGALAWLAWRTTRTDKST
jgi:hypothetical protein